MMNSEVPIYQALYMCYSRNAILRCVAWKGDFFEFEWVFCMSGWKACQDREGEVESIHKDNLAPLHEINEMEVIAYASR